MIIPTILIPTNYSNFVVVTCERGGYETAFAYSYGTCIGVRSDFNRSTLIAANEWSQTTARHLRTLEQLWDADKVDRVPHAKLLQAQADA